MRKRREQCEDCCCNWNNIPDDEKPNPPPDNECSHEFDQDVDLICTCHSPIDLLQYLKKTYHEEVLI